MNESLLCCLKIGPENTESLKSKKIRISETPDEDSIASTTAPSVLILNFNQHWKIFNYSTQRRNGTSDDFCYNLKLAWRTTDRNWNENSWQTIRFSSETFTLLPPDFVIKVLPKSMPLRTFKILSTEKNLQNRIKADKIWANKNWAKKFFIQFFFHIYFYLKTFR